MVNGKTFIPLYKQIEEELYSRIQNGYYSPSGKLPSEKELAKEFHVSTISIKKAILNLVEQNLLCRKQGKGTFIVTAKKTRELRDVIGFSQACHINGTVPGSRTLDQSVIMAPAAVKKALQTDDDQVIYISRLRYENHIPVCIETNWFPLEYSFLLKENLENRSLFELLHEKNIVLFSARRNIEICHATHEETLLLNVPYQSALLLVRSTVFNQEGKAVFFGKQVINADHFILTI